MTLRMTTAQVVETSVTVTNSSFQNYTHPDDHTTRTRKLFSDPFPFFVTNKRSLNNPDGVMRQSQAVQKSGMFFYPAQLAKG